MSGHEYIRVEFDQEGPEVPVGGTLRGVVRAEPGYLSGPRRVLLKVGYFIEGQGTPERRIFLDRVITGGFVPRDQVFEYDFELDIPDEGPLSYRGQCLSITWKAVVEEVRHRRYNRRRSFAFKVVPAPEPTDVPG
ncbi:MAG: hypothetical protein ACOCXX_04845 [Planctomycetota bacterium]